jgi:hypothetical protein
MLARLDVATSAQRSTTGGQQTKTTPITDQDLADFRALKTYYQRGCRAA